MSAPAKLRPVERAARFVVIIEPDDKKPIAVEHVMAVAAWREGEPFTEIQNRLRACARPATAEVREMQ